MQALSYFDVFVKFFEAYHNKIYIIIYAGTFVFLLIFNIVVSIIFGILTSRLEKKNLERLQNFGHRLQTKVEDIEMGTYGKDNDWCWFVLLKSGDEVFEEMLKEDPFGYLDFGDTIEVLIDPEDKENAYLNLESVFDLPINKERMQIQKWKEKEWFTLEE